VPCRFILPKDIEEGVDVECSDLYVLEQRTGELGADASRVIRLAVAVFEGVGLMVEVGLAVGVAVGVAVAVAAGALKSSKAPIMRLVAALPK
jgi:hypothetical protein